MAYKSLPFEVENRAPELFGMPFDRAEPFAVITTLWNESVACDAHRHGRGVGL